MKIRKIVTAAVVAGFLGVTISIPAFASGTYDPPPKPEPPKDDYIMETGEQTIVWSGTMQDPPEPPDTDSGDD